MCNHSRRGFIKRCACAAPAILAPAATPQYARAGSDQALNPGKGKGGVGNGNGSGNGVRDNGG